ncbi:MAG: tetratricopeptide repeat protein [Methanofollis sp.]|uniref:tetratricopeptide repeat protein n=1 Tax=Methanofollis sp. TaxID=2052835 RepID=UPI002610C9D8|nr:tetratricopeptide repeat protein [Methanofollis sp.]MDD4253757.1 tetratricopeptide repeat protein [Methanofollis sp.]
MTDQPPADAGKEAFALYEAGKYRESIDLCTCLLKGSDDSSLAILLATNLFALGEYNEAEAHLRDLLRKMPESSYLHSFLGRVLSARGDGRAVAAYARAVQLDPANEEALRAYAAYFSGKRDQMSAVPILSALARVSGKKEDARALIRALIECGRGEEALSAYQELLGGTDADAEYIDALMVAGRHRDAAAASVETFRRTGDSAFLRQYLAALSAFDRLAALKIFPRYLGDTSDNDLLFDYVLLLKSEGRCREALEACERLLARSPHPIYQLVACELIAATGQTELARECYEALIRGGVAGMDDPETLEMSVAAYEQFLRKAYSPETVPACYLETVSRDPNVVSLTRTGIFYASFGDMEAARDWLYRAYRLDFLNGGIEYARFLARQGETRECEKILIHILTNTRRTADLVKVAEAVIGGDEGGAGRRRLLDALVRRFSTETGHLGPEGTEIFARVCLCAARVALDTGDYVRCKEYCLHGLDLSRTCTDAFFDVVRRCKEATVAELPVFPFDGEGEGARAARADRSKNDVEEPDLGLDERETALVAFLRQHRETNEEELRKVLGTRRVSGVVNRLIKKVNDAGLPLIEKQGQGEHGEIYVYCGK